MTALLPDTHYHVYNRANGNEKIFISSENYRFFLKKYDTHIFKIANTLSYCLMPNHFHFLIQIKSEDLLKEVRDYPVEHHKQRLFLSKQFSNLFSSYTQAFNKVSKRRGSLFMRPFKRKVVDNEKYLRQLVQYIHFNPVQAGLVKNIRDWKYSSFEALTSNKPTALDREMVLQYFENIDNFLFAHSHLPDIEEIEDV